MRFSIFNILKNFYKNNLLYILAGSYIKFLTFCITLMARGEMSKTTLKM